ncbi:MAG: HAMP domain-containing histidine kinase [Bifidobacteriaceae bacterium]|jgi:two-component system sensor histidine kinase MtrB|nr:HAMP domain-containing histidine kinase [Bifidobacteriaceae bacterium]
MVTVILVSAVALAGIGWALTASVRVGIFNARLANILADSSKAALEAQEAFDGSSVGSPITAETLARDTVAAIAAGGAAPVAVSLLPPAEAVPGAISAIFTDSAFWPLASPELRASAAKTPDQQVWQSVALPVAGVSTDGSDQGAPGVAVAQAVSLLSNSYVLVMIYDLTPEQATMTLITEVLALSAAGVFLTVVLVTWLVTRQAVRPVRQAARVAAKLADGALGERIPVRGRDEMATLAASFNEMAASMQNHIERLEDLSNLQRRFVSDVSHELRTPLATIRMAGDMIHAARGEFPPQVARSAELLATQLDRFDALLADLLEISRFDAGAAQLETERVDLCVVVGWELEAVAPLAADRGVTIIDDIPTSPALAVVDTRRISRIVRNLVVNAIEHAGGGPVWVRVAANDRAVAVTVEDHGVGLDESQLERVFDRFWRADRARSRATGGTGLGLAIALEDANLHGGRLDVAGRAGVGAVFRLVVPTEAGREIGEPPLGLALSSQDAEALR